MKKFNSFLMVAIMFIMSAVNANAQMINKVNLESYAKNQYGTNWVKAANAESARFGLDELGNMVYTKTIDAPQLTKDDLYFEMANWFVCNYDNAIQFADKDQGVIIARPYIQNVAESASGFNAYNISICPTVRAQVKNGKVMVTYTLHDYNVIKENGGGNVAGALAIGFTALAVADAVLDTPSSKTTVVEHRNYGRHGSTTIYREYRPRHRFEDALILSCIADAAYYGPSKDSQSWSICDCYPFAAKDSHKKASSKAFVMANVYSQVVMDNIEKAISECNMAYAYNK